MLSSTTESGYKRQKTNGILDLSSWWRKKKNNDNDNSNQTDILTFTKVYRLKYGNCWISVQPVVPPELTVSAELFEELWKLHPAQQGTIRIYGKEIETPRFFQSFGKAYYFSNKRHEALPLSSHPLFQRIILAVQKHSGLPYDELLLNWYLNGKHYIGFHSDNEEDLVPFVCEPNAGVYSFSYGVTRKFHFKSKPTNKNDAAAVTRTELTLELQNNSGLIMQGETQEYYKHSVPKQLKCAKRRINITVRLMRSSYLPWLLERILSSSQLNTSTETSAYDVNKCARLISNYYFSKPQ